MNLASHVTPTTIVVNAGRYSPSKAVTLKVNSKTGQSVSSDLNNYTFTIGSEISYLELESSQYCWISSITVNYGPVAPTFSPAAGTVLSGTTVELSQIDDKPIYYTTDGTTPSSLSTLYTSAITIDHDMTIKAIAVDGEEVSDVVSATYTIAELSEPEFSVEDMTLVVGELKAPVVNTNSEGAITYTSDDPSIATIVDGKINAVAKGTVTIRAHLAIDMVHFMDAATAAFAVTVKHPAVWESTSKGVDVLTWSGLGISSTNDTYTSFNNKGFSSSARYAGEGASLNQTAIQMNASSPKGIVTTTSGGKVRKVIVSWYSTGEERILDVYAKNSAYTGASELYGSSDTPGTKIGSFNNKSAVVSLDITDDYEYVGFRSRNGALYLNSITIYWEDAEVVLTDDVNYTPVGRSYAKVTMDRPFQAGWNGIVLPFDLTESVMTALDASEVKTLGSATEEGGRITLNFVDASLPVAAGTPIMVKCESDFSHGEVVVRGAEIKTASPSDIEKGVDGNTFTLRGTYSERDLEDSEVYFVAGRSFYHKQTGIGLTAKPFRAYIVQTAAGSSRMDVSINMEGDEAAGITDRDCGHRTGSYYDLQGRKVAGKDLRKGLYIINGKKTAVK